MAAQTDLKKWADQLDGLLGRAIAARQREDVAEMVAVQKALRQFKEDSPDYADALDTQATLAIFDIDLQVTEDAVAAIKSRAEEVYRLTKLISGVAAEAEKSAKGLSGATVIQAIDAATSAISSFKKLRDQLSGTDPDEKKIATEIDAVLKAVQTLRGKLEIA